MNNNNQESRQYGLGESSNFLSSSGISQFQKQFDPSPNTYRIFPNNATQSISHQIRQFDYNAPSSGPYMMRNQSSPRLMDGLSNVLMQPRSALDQLEPDEKCKLHPKEQHIAVDEDTNEFACNKCVFEKRINKPLFMATFARTMKRKYDEKYNEILKNITFAEDLTPSLISQKIQTSIQDFFAQIYKQLKEIEKDVLQQIKSSFKLKDLAGMIESLHVQFNEELLKKLETEKNILEDKVERVRYGYIVVRKGYYNDLIKEMDDFCINLSQKIDQSNSLFNELLGIDIDQLMIYEKLYDLVENTIKIDGVQMQRKNPPPRVIKRFDVNDKMGNEEGKVNGELNIEMIKVSEYKTPEKAGKLNGHIESGQASVKSGSSGADPQMVNTFYTLKGTDVMKHKFKENSSEKIYTLNKLHAPKIAYTYRGQVFLIGGATNQSQKELKNTNYELKLLNGEMDIEEKAPMDIAKMGFGCTVDNYGENIYCIGGAQQVGKATNHCISYNIAKNEWESMPDLNEAKFSNGVCLFNDEWLYSFGGYGFDMQMSKTIERIQLNVDGPAWELIEAKLIKALGTMGSFQRTANEILVFGGYDTQNHDESYTISIFGSKITVAPGDDTTKLANPDIFLFGGGARRDVDKGEIIVCGQEYIHRFKEITKTFDTVRQLL